MEVKVLSRETILPSFPTPPHLRTFQLSLIDQLSPMLYIPLLFFYPMSKNNDDLGLHNDNPKQEIIATLKSSLSETLSRFYLLAGRIVDKSICCSDEGAVFIEASINCDMSSILEEPNNEVLMKLLPCSVLCSEPVEEYAQVVVQANIFNCGGIAISLCLLHKLMDGATFSCFLRSWASTNKRASNFHNASPHPKMACYDYKAFSSLFPQTNQLPFHPKVHSSLSPKDRKRRSLRRFVFGPKAILRVKADAKSSNDVAVVPNPTCVEAITAFIWKHAMKAADSSQRRPSTLSHVVDLRKRMEPPLPEVSVGNIMWGSVAHYQYSASSHGTDEGLELSELVGLLRNSFEKINDNEYTKELMGSENGRRAVLKLLEELSKWPVQNYYFCTSWRNMSLDEVDFGWGKPAWIAIALDSIHEMMTNVIVLLDSALGDGSVEAWILLDEEEMGILEQSPQFLEFASLNPSVHLP